MLSGLLHSDVAIDANIAIMRAFVQVRQYLLTTASMSSELKELRAKVDLLAMQQEENLGAVNDLSEDVGKDIDNLYLAIGYIHAFVIEQGKTLLMNGHNVGETALLLGFEFPHHFTRLFKKLTGITPTDFLGK